MKKLITLLTIAISAVIFNSCGSVKETTPTYKFFAKVGSTEWKTNEVLPSTTPTSATYVSYMYYSTSSKYINFEVTNPTNKNYMSFYVYIPSYANAAGTYTYDNGNFYPKYYIAYSDYPTGRTTTGSCTITKFTYDANTSKITNLTGTFNFTQTATHWDDVTRSYSVSEGQFNGLSQ